MRPNNACKSLNSKMLQMSSLFGMIIISLSYSNVYTTYSWVCLLSESNIDCHSVLVICWFVGQILLIQIKCFHEIITIGYVVYRSHELPWFRTLSWYFLITSNYFFYGESMVQYFGVFMSRTVRSYQSCIPPECNICNRLLTVEYTLTKCTAYNHSHCHTNVD